MHNSLISLPSKIIAPSDVLLFDNSFVLCHFELLQVFDLVEDFPIFMIHPHFEMTIVDRGDEIHVVSSLFDRSIKKRESYLDENRFTV